MNKLKSFYIIPFLLIFSLFLSGCSTKDNRPTTQITPTSTPTQKTISPTPTAKVSIKKTNPVAITTIKAVIENTKKFYCTPYKRNIYLKDFHYDDYTGFNDDGTMMAYDVDNENNTNHVYNEFCVIDMDNDGNQELLLEAVTAEAILVFHYESGKVYQNIFPFRGMNMVKTDGSFISSGGAVNNYIGKIKFSKSKVLYNELCSMEGQPDGKTILYRINGKEVNSTEGDRYFQELWNKEDAKWHDYNKANLNKYLK